MSSSSLALKRLDAPQADFAARLDAHLQREMIVAAEVPETVSRLLADVRRRGSDAVPEHPPPL